MIDLKGLEHQVLDAFRQGGLKKAEKLLEAAALQIEKSPDNSLELIRRLDALNLAFNVHWWSSSLHGAVLIRRSNCSDEEFFRIAGQNSEFRSAFGNRFGWKGDLRNALENNRLAVPGFTGSLFFTILYKKRSIGIISLTNIDLINRKLEFSIGLPFNRPAGIAHKSCLMMFHFLFWVIGINKVYTYVYSNNYWSSKNSRKLGLHLEGFINDFVLTDEGFVSAELFGLTKEQALRSEKLVRIVKRRINQTWH
jgi:RimJ/RimL family protein N-acetyltransferase